MDRCARGPSGPVRVSSSGQGLLLRQGYRLQEIRVQRPRTPLKRHRIGRARRLCLDQPVYALLLSVATPARIRRSEQLAALSLAQQRPLRDAPIRIGHDRLQQSLEVLQQRDRPSSNRSVAYPVCSANPCPRLFAPIARSHSAVPVPAFWRLIARPANSVAAVGCSSAKLRTYSAGATGILGWFGGGGPPPSLPARHLQCS